MPQRQHRRPSWHNKAADVQVERGTAELELELFVFQWADVRPLGAAAAASFGKPKDESLILTHTNSKPAPRLHYMRLKYLHEAAVAIA